MRLLFVMERRGVAYLSVKEHGKGGMVHGQRQMHYKL